MKNQYPHFISKIKTKKKSTSRGATRPTGHRHGRHRRRNERAVTLTAWCSPFIGALVLPCKTHCREPCEASCEAHAAGCIVVGNAGPRQRSSNKMFSAASTVRKGQRKWPTATLSEAPVRRQSLTCWCTARSFDANASQPAMCSSSVCGPPI